ncbi:hypothetical protein [Metabacillus fastidiosus]|uniref:hypothetical protein n=1 Tax=Metabacillus fastidiosus TaxID=1458 RepID=UPI003D2DED66
MNRLNLRRKKSWIFFSLITFMFVGFFSLITSKMYIADDQVLYHTEFYKEIKLSPTENMTLENWEWNQNENFMEVLLKIKSNQGYEFQAISKENSNGLLPVTLVYQNDENYVLKIENIPYIWEAMALDIYQVAKKEEIDIEEKNIENNEQEKDKKLVATLFAEQTKTKINNDLTIKEDKVYEIFFIDLEREYLKTVIEKNKGLIQKEKRKQRKIKEEIQELNGEMKYQTEIETVDTQRKIQSKDGSINQSNMQIENYRHEMKNAEEKINKLNQKEQDILNNQEK